MLTIIQQLCSMKQKHTKYTQINTNKSIYAQWNLPSVTKPNSENCKNCSSKCAYDCAQLQYTIQQNSSDSLPSYLQTTIIAQMLSIEGDGGTHSSINKSINPSIHESISQSKLVNARPTLTHWMHGTF